VGTKRDNEREKGKKKMEKKEERRFYISIFRKKTESYTLV